MEWFHHAKLQHYLVTKLFCHVYIDALLIRLMEITILVKAKIIVLRTFFIDYVFSLVISGGSVGVFCLCKISVFKNFNSENGHC